LLSVDEVSSSRQFVELEQDWGSVLEKCGDNNPFLTWDWISTSWKYFGGAKTLRTLVIKDSQHETLAIAPLRQSRQNFLGLLGYDVIEPLTFRISGSAYAGIMLPGSLNLEKQTECVRLFLRHLYQSRNWDFMCLFDIQEVSAFPGLLRRLNRVSEADYVFETGAMCYSTVLPSSKELLLKSLSGRFRHHLKGYLKGLEKDRGKVDFKLCDELGSVEKAVKVFFALHQKRRNSRNQPGEFDDQTLYDFYLEISRKLANRGWLALSFLTVDDEPVASMYCIEYNRKMYYLFGGFDPEYATYSIGNLLAARTLEHCIEQGIIEFDFGKGCQLSKLRYDVLAKRNLNIRFKNNTSLAALYSWGIKRAQQTRMDTVMSRFLH
jgi:CelD/BcsL family acetyltransferase involved in cellulose biosynthesis